ncbi:hypothetical protein ACULNC_25795 [Shigella flexneri]
MKMCQPYQDTASNQEPTLHRGLHNRHIQLIALGGAIGTVRFLALARLFRWRSGCIAQECVAGIIAFLIMRQLGEMVVESRIFVRFAHFAYKYWYCLRASSLAGTTG